MTIDEAISNVKSAMNAFPNQPDMVKLTIEHYNKLLELAPKAKSTSTKSKPSVPKPEPKKEEVNNSGFEELPETTPTIKDVKQALIQLAKKGESEREKAHQLLHEIGGVKKAADVPEDKRKELIDAARKVLTE